MGRSRKDPGTYLHGEIYNAVRKGRGEKIVSDNSKYIRRSKGVGRLTTYFLYGGGMDVFWNDPIDRILLDIYLFCIVHTARQ